MNKFVKDSQTSLSDAGPAAASQEPITGKPEATHRSIESLAWEARGLEGIKRMATDETYRKKIASKLS